MSINKSLAIIKQVRIATIDHITHIDNLESILKNGLLAHNNLYQKVDISNQDVNCRRNKIEPIYNRNIHDYVPLYFNPRNAMLYRNKSEFQDDIIILGFSKEIILLNDSIFTNGNAASDDTLYSNDINDLLNIDWDKVWSRTWNFYGNPDESIKKAMMAEVLIYKNLGIEKLEFIYCPSDNVKNNIKSNFTLNNIDVCVKKDIFF